MNVYLLDYELSLQRSFFITDKVFLSLPPKWQIIYKKYSVDLLILQSTFSNPGLRNPGIDFEIVLLSHSNKHLTHFFFLEKLSDLRIPTTVWNMLFSAFCFNLSLDTRHSHSYRFCDILVLLNKHHLCLCLE